jgi:hypothetical protein
MSRFQTWFGVPVPPWKPKKMKGGGACLRFVVTGSIPSKKNNNQATTVRRDAYDWIDDFLNELNVLTAEQVRKMARTAVKKVFAKVIPNKPYNEFLEKNRPIIEAQAAIWAERLRDKGLIFPVEAANVKIRFYWAHRHRQDTMNKAQSILDLLVSCRVLKDDDYTVTDPEAEGQCYHEEVVDNIAMIFITVDL